MQYLRTNYQAGKAVAKCQAMDISEIRATRLKEVIDTMFNGVASRLAEKIERQPAYVYRLFTEKPEHRRKIGEDLARDIEVKLGLQRGYLDSLSAAGDESQYIARQYDESGAGKKTAMKALADLPEEAAADIRPILDALKAKYKKQ